MFSFCRSFRLGFGVLILLPLCGGTAHRAVVAQSVSSESSVHQHFLQGLVAAAIERTHHHVRYDPAYRRIPYPGGDVPAGTGVCTDEVIRSYRAVGVDLQKEVHGDMIRNFSAYPRRWQAPLAGPDPTLTTAAFRT